ncbi:MAG: glycosyltransferase [Acidobacteriota bacterium]
MIINQLLPALHKGDAIGDEAFYLKDFFKSNGYQSEIYAIDIDSEILYLGKSVKSFPDPSERDTTILHYAIPSPLNELIKRVKGKKVIIYHNVTPEEFFVDFSKEMVNIAIEGKKQLKSLMNYIDLVFADSFYNKIELENVGFKNVQLLPLFINWEKYELKPDENIIELFSDEFANILFVGRVVPNKKIEDLMKVVAYYKKFISPLARLFVVGKIHSCREYYYSLLNLMGKLELTRDNLIFFDHVPDNELFALYQISDVFLSMSEHEGFCLPLIESMIFDLPVISYDSTAIPYTLNGAGILFNQKNTQVVAELCNLAIENMELREKILKTERERLNEFKKLNIGEIILNKFREIL